MKKFLDNKGDEWSMDLCTADLRRARAAGRDVLDHKYLQSMAHDIVEAIDTIYVLCQPQCEARGITDEEFGRRLAGDPIEDAMAATMEGIIDFFPPSQRAVAKSLIARINEVTQQAATLATEKMTGEKMGAAIQAAMTKAEKQIDQMLGELSGSLPG